MTDELRHSCEAVLRSNWRAGEGYACTLPSARRYPWQWYWDSCFAAIAWRRIDPMRARAELESLLRVQHADGFIGHTIFWDRPVRGPRRLFYNTMSHADLTTATIQPPMLAWAWGIAVGDPAGDPRIALHHDWVERNRDLAGDGLIWIVQPDESGLDASPAFDPVWGPVCDGMPRFPLLVARNRRLRFDARRIAAAGGPVVCEPLTNVLHGLSRLALGRPSITPELVARCYDERTGLFRLVSRPAVAGPVPVTWAALSPLALPDLPEEIGRRLVEDHLLDERRFWLPVAPASVDATDPAFTTKDRRLGLRRYWRGPTWVNAAWLIWMGLVRLGYDGAAARLADSLASTVGREGLREYYDPYTGRGMGARDFSWSSLVMELADPVPEAATSHLELPAVGR